MSGVRDLFRRKVTPEPEDRAAQGSRARDPDQPVRIAALTFCRDEGAMLPLWVQFYGDQFGTENLYVVDDNSEDGSTDDLPCDVLRIPPIRGGKFESTRMGFIAGLSRSLLELYDAVVFCDADEFHVPDPDRYSGLRDFIEQQDPDVRAIGALGLNVVHAAGVEEPLDLSQPLLGQRQLAKFLPLMCKPAIKFVPAPWYAASHGIRAPYAVDPDLWMFHLKFADRELLRSAADLRQAAVHADGRSRNTSWRRGGGEMVDLLDEITSGVTDVAAVQEFRPPDGRRLARLVAQDGEKRWRAPKGSQVELMRSRPLVRIPERFHGIV